MNETIKELFERKRKVRTKTYEKEKELDEILRDASFYWVYDCEIGEKILEDSKGGLLVSYKVSTGRFTFYSDDPSEILEAIKLTLKADIKNDEKQFKFLTKFIFEIETEEF